MKNEEIKLRKVYLLRFPDGKVYVGHTSQRLLCKRFQNGKGYKNQPKVYREILFWGWRNVEHEILVEQEMTTKQMLDLEHAYTLLYLEKGHKVLNKYNTKR